MVVKIQVLGCGNM